MVMVVTRMLADRGREARAHERGADADHEEAREHADPREEPLGDDPGRGAPGREAEQVDAERVRHGHHQAEEERVPGRAARPDEIGADDRLPVPRPSAWSAPSRAATRSEVSTRPRPTGSRVLTSSVIRSPKRFAPTSAPAGVAAARGAALPLVIRKRASLTCGGLWRRSAGYARSAWLRSTRGTLESASARPSPASATTSRQPARPAKFRSRNSSAPGCSGSGAVKK